MSGAKVTTILIVDDEPLNRKLLEAQLRPEGYRTVCAASGEEALASIAQCIPDLVLLDVMMPGMDGYEVAGTLKADPATASIPIIMVSAKTDRDARLAGLNAGVEEFLTKPVDHAELWLRVRNLLRLKELNDFLRNHGIILEQEVRLRTESLRASESRFRQLAENIRDVFFLVDSTTDRMLYVSPAYEEIWGRSCASVYVDAESWTEAFHPDDRSVAIARYRAGMLAGNFDLEFRIVRPDDSIRWIEMRGFPVRDDTGAIIRIASIAEDISERKDAESRIIQLNRIHGVLSSINNLIVRVSSRDELFRDACRIAIEQGRFRLALVGILDRSEKTLVTVGLASEDPAILDGAREILSADAGAIYASVAEAIEHKVVMVSNDLASDTRIVQRARHVQAGIRSMAILPLIVAGEVSGVFALYAGARDFFHAEEIKLLTELTRDIAFAIDHLEKKARLDYLAYYDELTGLANRSLFLERVEQYKRSAVRNGHKLAVFLIDMERFRNINDSLGRAAGDALLRRIAEWLTARVGEANLLARLEADHFAVVVPDVRESGNLEHLLEKTLAALQAHPFRLDDAVFRVSVKVGVAVSPDDGTVSDHLLRNADAALKRAKAHGDRYRFYTPEMTETSAVTLSLENQLRRAMDNDEFVLHYQPMRSFADGGLSGAEALIRWNDPRTGLVPPGLFIPVLEETGLIFEVGRWALRTAIAQHLQWRAAGLPAVRVAVNVSALQMRHRDFVAELARAIGVHEHAAAGLTLEITESLIMEDVRHTIASLKAIRALGVRIAIDDFGTGFSSLNYLAQLPVDTLKIDRSFVTAMTASPQGLALVSTIIGLAHAMEIKVVAEGVETEEQADLLRLLSCDEMQGFLLSKALPAEEFRSLFLPDVCAV